MTSNAALPTTPLRLGWYVLLLVCLVWLTATLQPLFYSNQNTKFLHGLAQAGFGYLNEDWMANTIDGLPVFTFIVRWTAEIGPFWLFYVEQFAVYTVHAAAMLLLFRQANPWIAAAGRLPLLLFVLVYASLHVELGITGGLAQQLIIKSIYEPANFGAFAMLGIAAFVARRPIPAALLINVAAAFHAGYVAPGAFLLLGMAACLPLLQRPERRRLLVAVALGLALLALNAYLLKLAFPATSPELQAKATDLLANQRIPQHTDPTRWLDLEAMAKLALCIVAVVVATNRLIARVLAVGVIAIVASGLLVLLVEANFVRLISPWRVSVFLVPLAWVVVIGWLMQRLLPWFRRHGLLRWVVAGAVATVVVVAGIGLWLKVERFSRPDGNYIAMVKQHLGPGQVYLTAPNLSSFRLRTGAPQYISEKSHPYLDVEVLEWARRLEVAEGLYRAERFDCDRLAWLRDEEGVTHLLVGEDSDPRLDCPFATELEAAGKTRLYRLDAGPS